jgi:predicted HicB family RNase H-like nuclease
MPTVTGVAAINYDIDDNLHRRAKAAAALEGVTLKQFLEDALEAAIKRSEKGGR